MTTHYLRTGDKQEGENWSQEYLRLLHKNQSKMSEPKNPDFSQCLKCESVFVGYDKQGLCKACAAKPNTDKGGDKSIPLKTAEELIEHYFEKLINLAESDREKMSMRAAKIVSLEAVNRAVQAEQDKMLNEALNSRRDVSYRMARNLVKQERQKWMDKITTRIATYELMIEPLPSRNPHRKIYELQIAVLQELLPPPKNDKG